MTRRAPDADVLLARLLGPAGRELGCEACFAALDRYVELELSRSPRAAEREIPGMAAHLAGCPACREEHDSLRALLRADRGAGDAPA
jgi:predicted anti-sigma-YlaC factor YlaD